MELLSRKKIKSPSADGQSAVTPTENTGIKLEAFIFDCFNKSKRMAVLEGPRSEEFSPVKNAPGSDKDSPDTARAMLTEQSKKWLRAGDIEVIDGPGQVRTSACFAPLVCMPPLLTRSCNCSVHDAARARSLRVVQRRGHAAAEGQARWPGEP